MLLRASMICCLTAVLLPAPAAHAGMTPARVAASDVRLAAQGCGLGSYRDAGGACIDRLDRTRNCGPGYFPLTFPNGNHYRCVPVAWLRASGWFGDLF